MLGLSMTRFSTCLHVRARARRFSYAETDKRSDSSFRPEKPENNSGEPCNPLSNAGLRKIDSPHVRDRFSVLGYVAGHEIDSCNKYATRDGKSGH